MIRSWVNAKLDAIENWFWYRLAYPLAAVRRPPAPRALYDAIGIPRWVPTLHANENEPCLTCDASLLGLRQVVAEHRAEKDAKEADNKAS